MSVLISRYIALKHDSASEWPKTDCIGPTLFAFYAHIYANLIGVTLWFVAMHANFYIYGYKYYICMDISGCILVYSILLGFHECVECVDNAAAAGGPFIKFELTIASISCIIYTHTKTHTHTHTQCATDLRLSDSLQSLGQLNWPLFAFRPSIETSHNCVAKAADNSILVRDLCMYVPYSTYSIVTLESHTEIKHFPFNRICMFNFRLTSSRLVWFSCFSRISFVCLFFHSRFCRFSVSIKTQLCP